jgi:hypothetical protein
MPIHLFHSRSRRRERLRAQSIPSQWPALLSRNVPLFVQLSADDQRELLGHMQVLVAEKNFEGCGGLLLTEEIITTIAAQACLLLLHRETNYFPRLQSILVYPTGYSETGERPIDGVIWEEGRDDRLGQADDDLGALVLAWDSVRHGAADPWDGENLVLHEFAHQLDFEDPGSDGVPALTDRKEYAEWRRIMAAELERLRSASDAGADSLLDPYGATDLAELFAVATETFFELPRAMKKEHPELYAAMRKFYNQNPEEFCPA